MKRKQNFGTWVVFTACACVLSACVQPPVNVVNGASPQRKVVQIVDASKPGAVLKNGALVKPGTVLSNVAYPLKSPARAEVMPVKVVDASSVERAPIAPVGSRTLQEEVLAEKPEVVVHKVLAADTLYKIADFYHASPNVILADNGLKYSTDVREGMVLKVAKNSKPKSTVLADMQKALLPESGQAASTLSQQKADMSLAAIEPAAGRIEPAEPKGLPVQYTMHRVQPKETLYRISLQYGVSALDIMAANDFSDPQDLKADTTIRVPLKSAATTPILADKSFVPALTPASDPATGATMAVQTKTDFEAERKFEAKVVREQALSDAEMRDNNVKPVSLNIAKLAEQKRGHVDSDAARASGLVWPVQGQILRKFGDNGNGVALTGINIAVPEGTPVLASESGKVLYADSGLKIYGNLVLIRHDNGMVSAYAHNSYLLVKKNERVKKGQVVALSGASGNVDSPQLHFELRQHASAVDPLRVLPRL